MEYLSRDLSYENGDALNALVGRKPEIVAILRSLQQIVQGVAIHSKSFLARSGLTVPQVLILKAVAAAGDEEITAADAARATNIGPSSVTAIVDKLETLGMMERKHHAQDRRKICLCLTPKGEEHQETLPPSPVLQTVLLNWLRSLDASRLEETRSILGDIAALIGGEQDDASPVLSTRDNWP